MRRTSKNQEMREHGIACTREGCTDGIRRLTDRGEVTPCPVCGDEQWESGEGESIPERVITEVETMACFDDFKRFLAAQASKMRQRKR